MEFPLLNLFFPRMCYICKRYGNYICHDCKKLLKRNLPECYICRRLSPTYATHSDCTKSYSLDSVFVAWEYNKISSDILKQYKYKNIHDISEVLSNIFVNAIQNSSFQNHLKKTLLVPVPISNTRRMERGFNQMESITLDVGRFFGIDVCKELVFCKNSKRHQAGKSKAERYRSKHNPYYIKNCIPDLANQYESITLVDDVITTGSTLEMISQAIRDTYGSEIQINALCMFRGKPYYLPNSQPPL